MFSCNKTLNGALCSPIHNAPDEDLSWLKLPCWEKNRASVECSADSNQILMLTSVVPIQIVKLKCLADFSLMLFEFAAFDESDWFFSYTELFPARLIHFEYGSGFYLADIHVEFELSECGPHFTVIHRWAALCEVPNVLSRCHTKRRTGARGSARPSFGMTPTF